MPPAPLKHVTLDSSSSRRSFGTTAGMLLFVMLALIAFQSARLGVSGLIVELAQHEVDRWTIFPRSRGMQEINRVAGYFADSLGYAPDNPWAQEGLGALDLARMRLTTNPQEASAFAREARAKFRLALRQRPTSPFLWANLALSKLYLDELDAEFLAALRNADELGRWEPTPQQAVLFAGLAAWERLDSGLRHAVGQTLKRGAKRNAAKMFEIVKSFGRFDLVCAIREYDSLAGSDCRRAESAAAPGRPTIKGGR